MLSIERDSEASDDSDEERDTKHNLLDPDDGDMIEEEEEGAECDDGDGESSEELPLIKDGQRFKPIQQIESDQDTSEIQDSSTATKRGKCQSFEHWESIPSPEGSLVI